MAGEFAAQRASNAEDVPFDDVIMEWKSSDEMGPQDIKATIANQLNLMKVDLPRKGRSVSHLIYSSR